ncbi:MAG: elongation factor Ts [Halanaerobiaceae bacterium]|nr:elongation factor Ts [Halanaerobiaceae bacterium]
MPSMKDIKELRERTGAGIMDCKKALQETNGDIEAAIEYLREKGIAAAAKKAGRIAAEGKVSVLIDEDRKKGVILEVNSETDFVAKTDNFNTLLDNLSRHLLQSNANSMEDVLAESWFMDDSKDVNTVIKEAIANIGENLNLRRFNRYETDGFLYDYIHMGGKIGVIVDIDGENTEENQLAAKDIAMHVAASAPEYIDRFQVPADVVEREKNIYKEQMLNEGKPEHVIEKIVEGKLDKFYSEICLLEQAFVKDTDKTVAQVLEENGLKVNAFTRFELGEGIERKEENFAEEVMKELGKNK